MEEIIASISRIIAEDNRAAHPAPNFLSAKNAILELTEAIEPDGSVRIPGGESCRPAEPVKDAAHGSRRSANRAPSEATIRVPRQRRASLADNLLSGAASGAAIAAFGRLGMMSRERRRRARAAHRRRRPHTRRDRPRRFAAAAAGLAR